MKTSLLVSLLSGLFLVGCGDSSTKSSSSGGESSGGSVVSAPTDYLKTITKAQQSAEKTVDVTSIKSAIDMFNVSEGRYPKDLNELVEKKYMPKIPELPHGMKYVYDVSTGTVKTAAQ